MLFKIAWRNIWRSKTRSITVILSIAIGVWALSFVLSFSNGITYTFIQNAIRDQYSHLQLHHPKFPEDKNSKYFIKNKKEILAAIKQMPATEALTGRVIANGMVSSSRGARGVQIMGVNPETEKQVTHFDKNIVEGSYFKEGKRNQILISKRIAEKLKVKLRSRIVLTFQNMEGEITAAAFRVAGLFSTGNMMTDEALVYVVDNDLKKNLLPKQSDSTGIVYSDNIAHEIAVFLKNSKDIKRVKEKLKNEFPGLLVQDYWELSPDIELYETQIKTSNSIIIAIFMLALIFGIINTMLMAVLERYKELGMLMAIGMNKAKIFFMIVLETLMLSAVAAPIGLGAGFLTVYLLQDTGIDLSSFAKGLERFGMETTIIPVLDFGLYIRIATAVFITALLASIYPARKAVKLKPVEALHKI
ncbi:MAG TPA: ABC transporter permease [Bacteroidetes bacterium]|nr:ABC transporter permease [Bacteroidota bacterium]